MNIYLEVIGKKEDFLLCAVTFRQRLFGAALQHLYFVRTFQVITTTNHNTNTFAGPYVWAS